MTSTSGDGSFGWRGAIEVAGPVAAVAIAWITADVADSMALANVALLLAAVTVAVAMVGWRGGLATSVAAALSLNYFHTEPVNTFRITQESDLVSVLLLGSLGVAVSIGTALRARALSRSRVRARAAASRATFHDLGRGHRSVIETWIDSIRSVSPELALVDCHVEAAGRSTRPSIARSTGETSSLLVLPEGGATIALDGAGAGQVLVLAPRAGAGSLELDRRAVEAFVAQLQLSLHQTQ